jgi:lysozyme family protein
VDPIHSGVLLVLQHLNDQNFNKKFKNNVEHIKLHREWWKEDQTKRNLENLKNQENQRDIIDQSKYY